MNDTDMRRPLMDNVAKFDQLTEQISEKIDLLREYVEMLSEYKSKMGTADDTRSLRRRMQTEITEGNDLIKQILDLQQEMDDIKFKKRKDIENYNKMSRRLNNTFDDYYEKFTKVLKEIHSKEKIHLDIRQSETHNASITQMSATSDAISERHVDHESQINEQQQDALQEVRNNLEFYASIISERENLRGSIRKAPVEADTTEDVTKRYEEDSADLEGPIVVQVESVEREYVPDMRHSLEENRVHVREVEDIREVGDVEAVNKTTSEQPRQPRRGGGMNVKTVALTAVVFIACVMIALLIYFNSAGS